MAAQSVQIAIGIVANAAGEIIVTKRSATAHQGGLWEFPGGKCEPDETVNQAVQRELHEELGIHVLEQRPLIQISHQYPTVRVNLQVHQVTNWQGEPTSCEGQPIRWVEPQQLANYPMPAANQPIIRAIQLPDQYLITPPRVTDQAPFLYELEQALKQGIRLVQFRVFGLTSTEYATLVWAATECCQAVGAEIMLNTEIERARELGVRGIHMNSQQLAACQMRPAGFHRLAASCHNAADLQQAQRIGADFAVLSPVLPTQSHPKAVLLGWQSFAEQVAAATIPVYAMGGMTRDQLSQAWQAGAQGIAGIRGLWPIGTNLGDID